MSDETRKGGYRCVICTRQSGFYRSFCAECRRAWDRWNRGEAETMELIIWVARRARRLAGKARP